MNRRQFIVLLKNAAAVRGQWLSGMARNASERRKKTFVPDRKSLVSHSPRALVPLRSLLRVSRAYVRIVGWSEKKTASAFYIIGCVSVYTSGERGFQNDERLANPISGNGSRFLSGRRGFDSTGYKRKTKQNC